MSYKNAEMTTLDVKCQKCKLQFTRQIKLFSPEEFSKDGTKSIMSQYWCPQCRGANAARYEFYRDKNKEVRARVKRYVNVDNLFVRSPAQQSISLKNSSDNRDDEV